MSERPFARTVLHASDLSLASGGAFVHALALAVRGAESLTILHASARGLPAAGWERFPRVRATLEGWGLLEPGSARAAVWDVLGLDVKKVEKRGDSPHHALLGYLAEREVELLVLGTEGRAGLGRLLHRSLAEELARRSETMTLFVPHEARGFVDAADGALGLQTVLVPVDQSPSPRGALDAAARLVERMGAESPELVALHVGRADTAPGFVTPPGRGRWSHACREGPVVDVVLEEAREREADLIVMATHGHEGALDALRGSTTEQVLRRAPCPLLAVPARS